MVMAGSPSLSAMAIAVRHNAFLGQLGLGHPSEGTRRLPSVRSGLSEAGATTVPTPTTARTRPSACNAASALVAVAMATPQSRVICRADGTRSPGRS